MKILVILHGLISLSTLFFSSSSDLFDKFESLLNINHKSYQKTFDENQSNVGVWLSGAAYCNKDKYLSMKLNGPAEGFIVTEVLYDKRTDLQGFIGILPSTSTIYITFRGTSSILNWLDDIEVRQTAYITFPECGCKVHSGFYKSTLSLSDKVLEYIIKLKSKYPTYQIITTGHSLAASISQLISMELSKHNIESSIYNYGQPRVGNQKYAEFVNKKITNYWRFTHNKDMVPHVPPMKEMDYYHSCIEVFQNEKNQTQICGECEDPRCSNQYTLYETNTKDHLVYLNHVLSCEDSATIY